MYLNNTLHFNSSVIHNRVDGIVSDEAAKIFQYVVDISIGLVLSVVGMIGNILIIVVFSKMGFQETSNITMTFIAVFDLVRCVCYFIIKFHGPLQLISRNLALSWENITTVVFGFLNIILGNVSGVLAAYVAIERCLYVSLPFTVKSLLTPKVVVKTCVVLSLVCIASSAVIYCSYELVQTTDRTHNETVWIFRYNSLRRRFPDMMLYIYAINIFFPVGTFCIALICTVIILYHLKNASMTRSKITGGSNSNGKRPNELPSREKQVIKMLLIINIVYIVGYVPKIAHYTTMAFVPEFNFRKTYNNMFWILLYFVIAFDLINSSVNVIIFMVMSSQFNKMFKRMFVNIHKIN